MGNISRHAAVQAMTDAIAAAISAINGDLEMTYEEFCASARLLGKRPATLIRAAEEARATLLAIGE